MTTQSLTARTMNFDARTETFGTARPVPEVVRDVARWQSALLAGRDPGATPIGETGWPLSRLAARTYFGSDVLASS